MGGWWGWEKGNGLFKEIKEEGVGMNKATFLAIQVSKLAKMKGNLQHGS